MESDSNLMKNFCEQDLTTLSTANNLPATSYQQPFSSSANKIQHKQSKEITVEPKNKFLKKIDKRSLVLFADDCLTQSESLIALIKNLQLENKELKVKQATTDKKDERLKSYENMVYALRAKCDEKDTKLADKDNLIENLQAEVVEKNVQLQAMSNKIEKFQEACNSKNAQLGEKLKLIEKLQRDCAQKDSQMTATIDRLKSLGNCLHDNNKLIDALCKCASKCWDQKHYDEELVYWQNAIELEKATQNRPSKLSGLFANKAGCHHGLKQYQQSINAANLALQHDPNQKIALNNRGASYKNLKQYSNALQDLEKALQLDPTYELAQNNLKRLQELINASSSQ